MGRPDSRHRRRARAGASEGRRAGRGREGGRPEVSPRRAADEANLAEVRAELDRIGELVDRIPDRQAEQRAQREEVLADPGLRPAQAEADLEASWRSGQAGRHPEPSASAEAESADFEMEI